MKPKTSDKSGQLDLFRSHLDQLLNQSHPLVQLSKKIDWPYLEEQCAVHFSDVGRPGVCSRLIIGLHLLKQIDNLSDEVVCERWVENPYYQYFCGEDYFQHTLNMDRSSMTNWRKRVGKKFIDKLLQESLRVAHESKALRKSHIKRVAVDTTVQPKAIKYPTDAHSRYKAIVELGKLAKKHGIQLRQSYVRVCKQALVKSGRYRHAKQMRRAKRQEKFILIRLGRLIRDISRRIDGNEHLRKIFSETMRKAKKLFYQKKNSKDKLYAWHAPEVECIAKGKAAKPYEFGCKVSVSTNINSAPGGHFILEARALHGVPHDSKTLKESVETIENNTGIEIERIYVDKGYQGHNYDRKHRVFKSGQKRGVFGQIKKELRRRTVIEPVIGHLKENGRMGRNYLKGKEGDELNAGLAAVGFNFKQLLNWFSKKINTAFRSFKSRRIHLFLLENNTFSGQSSLLVA